MKDTIVSTMCLAPISVYAALSKSKHIYLEVCEHYQKRSYRNRAILAGPNGLSRISIPLERGKNNGTPITDVHIAYHDDWVGEALHTIRTCLGSAPYFEYYYDDVAAIFRTRHHKLIDLNQAMHSFVCRQLGLDLVWQYTEGFEAAFEGRDLRWYREQPVVRAEALYSQVFADRHGYIHNLSVLDLLFCTGPAAGGVLLGMDV